MKIFLSSDYNSFKQFGNSFSRVERQLWALRAHHGPDQPHLGPQHSPPMAQELHISWGLGQALVFDESDLLRWFPGLTLDLPLCLRAAGWLITGLLAEAVVSTGPAQLSLLRYDGVVLLVGVGRCPDWCCCCFQLCLLFWRNYSCCALPVSTTVFALWEFRTMLGNTMPFAISKPGNNDTFCSVV